MITKQESYRRLIEARKGCSLCTLNGFKNQSQTKFDFDEIGNWTSWSNNLDADIMIVGQDYADEYTFNRDSGKIETKVLTNDSLAKEYTTVTNYYLRELTKSIGYDIGIPTENIKAKVFLTNSVLCIKSDPTKERVMSKSIPQSVYKNCGSSFLKPTIDIVQPKVIIALGSTATNAIIRAFSDKIEGSDELLRSNFTTIFKNGALKIKDSNMVVVPVYHTGILGQNNRKKIDSSDKNRFELMKEDWAKIKELL
jgi:uracil-DNA glycosylase family 4